MGRDIKDLPRSVSGPAEASQREPHAGPAKDIAAMASAPDVLDLRATARDTDASARDAAAERRSAGDDEIFAARDRAAAALDRREAALDRQRAQEYRERAYRDELTGVLLRAAGRDQLVMAVDRARRTGDSLVLVFLDVDHLKRVNDEGGHGAGDELLRAVGAGLLQHLRSYDVVVRYGGDEFVCALPGSSVADTSRRLAAVGAAVATAVPGASVSSGLAELGADDSLDDVIARADRGMYAGRRESRGLTVVPHKKEKDQRVQAGVGVGVRAKQRSK